MLPRAKVPLLALVVLASLPACAATERPPESPPVEVIARLESPRWEERQRAAESLLRPGGPPVASIQPLYRAIRKEQNPKAFGAMLVTLGASGIFEARALIDPRVNDPDVDTQRWAREALRQWLVRNMLLTESETLPPPPNRFYGPADSIPPSAPGAHPTPGLVP